MYFYKKTERFLWTVGYEDTNGQWHPESDHDTPHDAARRVAILNGDKSPNVARAITILEQIRDGVHGFEGDPTAKRLNEVIVLLQGEL